MTRSLEPSEAMWVLIKVLGREVLGREILGRQVLGGEILGSQCAARQATRNVGCGTRIGRNDGLLGCCYVTDQGFLLNRHSTLSGLFFARRARFDIEQLRCQIAQLRRILRTDCLLSYLEAKAGR